MRIDSVLFASAGSIAGQPLSHESIIKVPICSPETYKKEAGLLFRER